MKERKTKQEESSAALISNVARCFEFVRRLVRLILLSERASAGKKKVLTGGDEVYLRPR